MAIRWLGRIEGLLSMARDPGPMIEMLVRREAVALWNRENNEDLCVGDLLLYELGEPPWFSDGSPFEDIARIANALRRCAVKVGQPSILDGDAIQSIQAWVLGQGGSAPWRSKPAFEPGKRRDASHARLTYPDAAAIPTEVERWTEFVKSQAPDALVKAALAHTKIELLRPFGDGDGVIAGLLLHSILLRERCLSQPVLYLSEYLDESREARLLRLQSMAPRPETKVSKRLWESNSVLRILAAVSRAAADCCTVIPAVDKMFADDEHRIRGLGRASDSALKAFRLLKRSGATSVPAVRRSLAVSFPTADAAIQHLVRLGIVSPLLPWSGRNRLFAYLPYLKHLNAVPKDFRA